MRWVNQTFICVALVVLASNARAETATIIKPGLCSDMRDGYLLAMNSGALIRSANDDERDVSSHVILFRPGDRDGWASQRILRRFDLEIARASDAPDVVVINSGGFCDSSDSK